MKNLSKQSAKHPLRVSTDGLIHIDGFSVKDANSLCCFRVGECEHFSDYGIAKGSLLVASMDTSPKDGDLVVVSGDEADKVKVVLYRPNGPSDNCTHPTTSDKNNILGVILSSFSFYR